MLCADVNLDMVAQHLPRLVTGADIGAVTTTAYSLALERKLAQIEREVQAQPQASQYSSTRAGADEEVGDEAYWTKVFMDDLSEEDLAVEVCQSDLLTACHSITPSVTESELGYYEQLQPALDRSYAH